MPGATYRNSVTGFGGNLYSFGGIYSNSYKFDGTTWTAIAPLPVALFGTAAVNDGTYAYVLGGFDQSSMAYNTVYRYDPIANSYATMATMITRGGDQTAVYLNGKIYKFCGANGPAYTNVLEIYDIATNTWSTGASCLITGSDVGGFVYEGFIYAVGGHNVSPPTPLTKTCRYDPATNTWNDAAIADLPVGRWGGAVDSYLGGVVLAGGHVGSNDLSDSVVSWDGFSNTWSNLPNLPAARTEMGGAVLDGSFYVVGGSSGFNGTTNNQKLTCPSPTPSPTPTPTPNPGIYGKIAFSSNRGDNEHYDIYVMDPDGSHVIRLTDNLGYNFSPVWSPDGTRIAFSSYQSSNGNYEIYVMNPDGSGLTNLTHHPASDDLPAWSPDGTKIAFSTTRSPGANLDICIMNADGSNQTLVTENPANDFAPTWSPDGTKIAFCTDRHDPSGYDYEIYVMDAAGGNEVRLTYNTGQDLYPAYSPDGTKIAFANNRLGNGIFVMNADGTNPIRLTTNPTGVYNPAWSPDGAKIISTSYGANEEITMVDANGANPINLTNNPASDMDPSWQRKPTSTPVPAQALNISTRMRVETGNNVLIAGFIINGTAPKTVALRGIGPSLAQLGIPNFLDDPTLQLRDSSGALVMQNDNWQDDPSQAAQLSALGLGLLNPKESGMVTSLSPNAYTAVVAGKNAGTGIGLVEVYDSDPAANSQLANISSRGFVRDGDKVMIGGFILGGSNNTQVVARGIGPSLAQFGLSPVLADPILELHDGNGALLVSNDNWQDNSVSASHLSAFELAPQDAAESGIYVSLPPGAFTAILAGKNGGIGLGLVEIYNLR